VELDAARLVGGSEADRSRVLERVHEYLEANASFDWGQLQDIWSGAPEAVYGYRLTSERITSAPGLPGPSAVLEPPRRWRRSDDYADIGIIVNSESRIIPSAVAVVAENSFNFGG
jgi:hypothetical protein